VVWDDIISDERADISMLSPMPVAAFSGGSARKQSYEPLLLENEREAVSELLHHLESESKVEEEPACKHVILTWLPLQPPPDRTTTNFFTGSPLASLTTLSFSDNVDLQRSAALAFAEITEKEVREVGRDTLDPVLFLLGSHDTEVQRAASAALGNLAVNRESTSFITFHMRRRLTRLFHGCSGEQAVDR
jgi:vacuolar protein 8